MSNAKVLAIANQKGGVGKTTTALSLSEALAAQGKKVLLLDLDSHCCASVHLRYYTDVERYSVYDIFKEEGGNWAELWSKIIQKPEGLGFDFCPASTLLADLDAELKTRSGKGGILSAALTSVLDNYDFIILDCPPHLGILLINALLAATLLVVPIQTDFLALHGLKLLIDTVKTLNKARAFSLDYRVLPTMYDKRAKACQRIMNLLYSKMHERVFKAVIGMDTKFREASAMGTVIYKIDPHSRGAKAYNLLAEEITALW